MVVIELDVVFPAPNHLYRLPSLFREHSRFCCEVRFRFAPEASSEKRHVARYVFLLQSERLRDLLLKSLRILRRSPNRRLVVSHIRDGHRWLHRRMRQVRSKIFRLNDLAALGKLRIGVSDAVHHLARLDRKSTRLN